MAFRSPFPPPSPRSLGRKRPSRDRKRGQTLIFMALVVVMIAFAALFYFDVNKVLHVKAISRNGGDAAALAGARWQAISLNLIGSLNIAQAAVLTDALTAGLPSSPESDLISELQRRIAFSGPMYGLIAAQQAGKKNGLHNREDFADSMNSHINLVRNEYGLIHSQPFQPSGSYATAWDEVADMYSLVADHGLVAHPAWQYYATYSNYDHLLLNPAFYDAIAGGNWCWFHWNEMNTLENYSNWTEWDELPSIEVSPPVNSEVLSLHQRRVRVRDSVPVLQGLEWDNLMDDLQDVLDQLEDDEPDVYANVQVNWSYYNTNRWTSWQAYIPSNFPWDRDIREEYDYGGADSAMMIQTSTERHTEFQGGNLVEWTAVAKPFGSLDNSTVPSAYGLILPAYTDVRLIPVDTSMSGGNSQLRPGWLDFIMNILPDYMQNGPSVLPTNNYYASQLIQWEVDEFREAGIEWLLNNSGDCYTPPSGGGGSSGGTSTGH